LSTRKIWPQEINSLVSAEKRQHEKRVNVGPAMVAHISSHHSGDSDRRIVKLRLAWAKKKLSECGKSTATSQVRDDDGRLPWNISFVTGDN
jgi:hypothetical protein